MTASGSSSTASPAAVGRLLRDAEAAVRLLRNTPEEVPRGPAVLRDVPFAFGGLLPEVEAGGGEEWFPESEALRMGRTIAVGLHLAGQLAWAKRYGTGEGPGAAIVDRLLLGAEREHRLALLASRSAARRGDLEAVQEILEETVVEGHGARVALCRGVGSLSPAERGAAGRGLRASRLQRRTAMLAAGLVWLGWRLMGSSRRAGTGRIAENRPVLVRSDPRLRSGARGLARFAEGERTAATGRVVEVGWVERPEIPYSRATLEGGAFEIRVHRRNLARLGVAPGAWLWARGKVESDGGAPVLVAEFEGSGQHAGEVWEDWLADGVRDAYDLYPSVVFAEWEFPVDDPRGERADLRSRISATISAGGTD